MECFIVFYFSCYGKFAENLIKQTDIKLVSETEEFEKLLSSPFYKSHTVISEEYCIVENFKKNIELNRPSQLGVSILEFAKEIMFKV